MFMDSIIHREDIFGSFLTSFISPAYLHLLQVLQNILETEREYAKELQSLLGTYLKSLQSYDK